MNNPILSPEQLAGATPRLPDDVCRCWAASCPEREQCRRWLGRNTGGVRVRHSSSFFKAAVGSTACTNRIAPYEGPGIRLS